MKASNNPDVGIAQEWSAELDTWLRRNGFRGYTEEDLYQAPWWGTVARRAALYRLLRRMAERYPSAARKLVGAKPATDPLVLAYHALGTLRLLQLESSPVLMSQAAENLAALRACAHSQEDQLAWGRPFDFHGRGFFIPAGRPTLPRSVAGGEAYLRAYRVTGDEAFLAAARSVAEFLLTSVPRLHVSDKEFCFGAAVGDRRCLHAPNAMAGSYLLRVWAVTEEERLLETATRALAFTAARQGEDGAWRVGEPASSEPGSQEALGRFDHRAMSVVLRSFASAQRAKPQSAFEEVFGRGLSCYRRLFTTRGRPVDLEGQPLADGRTAAEAVLCLSMLSEQSGVFRQLAVFAMRYAYCYLRGRDGRPCYSKAGLRRVRLRDDAELPALWHWALAEYQAALAGEA